MLLINLQIPFTNAPINHYGDYIVAIFSFALIASGVIALVKIIFGGFQWILSAGDASKAANARDSIAQAVLGLILLFATYLILSVINVNLVNINPKPVEFRKNIQSPPVTWKDFFDDIDEKKLPRCLVDTQNEERKKNLEYIKTYYERTKNEPIIQNNIEAQKKQEAKTLLLQKASSCDPDDQKEASSFLKSVGVIK